MADARDLCPGCGSPELFCCSYDEEFDDGYCIDCGGDGWLMDCPDDLCHGQGWCMHGDGDRPCPTCNGDGVREPFPEALPRYALENGWTPASEASDTAPQEHP